MMGLSRAMTACALVPRRDRSSARSRSRIRLTAALPGLISSLPRYWRILNPRKSKPWSRVTMRVLSSLKARPLGASRLASRALTCSASCLVWQTAARSSAYLISTGEPGTAKAAALPTRWYRTPAACSIPCSATFSSAELAEEMVVVDPVECRCQVRVEHPHPARARAVAALACLEDGLDRVMAATAGPEAIRPRLEPCLPLGFRRTGHARLLRAVRDHRDTEGPLLPAGLRDIHPPDRTGRPRFGLVLQPPGQVSPVLRGQHYLPVDTRRLAASINLRHPPHADQRVRPGPEHQLLQVADPLEVPRLRRREDPLPQTPYVLLSRTPVHL